MPLPANECFAAVIFPDSAPMVGAQLDALLVALRGVCPDFVGEGRDDNAWVFVPVNRMHANAPRNLLIVWSTLNGIRLDIRPFPPGVHGPERFDAGSLGAYQQRMQTGYERMLALQ